MADQPGTISTITLQDNPNLKLPVGIFDGAITSGELLYLGGATETVIVDAGNPQTEISGANVALSAQVTNVPSTYAQVYQWTQTAGATVTLNGDDTLTPSFTVPAVMDNIPSDL